MSDRVMEYCGLLQVFSYTGIMPVVHLKLKEFICGALNVSNYLRKFNYNTVKNEYVFKSYHFPLNNLNPLKL